MNFSLFFCVPLLSMVNTKNTEDLFPMMKMAYGHESPTDSSSKSTPSKVMILYFQ